MMWTRFKMAMLRFMQGRNGVDQLGWHAMWGGLILMLALPLLGLPSLPGHVLYFYAFFRILSRNVAKRQAENARYTQFAEKAAKEVKQFFLRLKGMKEFMYFRCPGCRSRLRLRRGSGPKHVTCPVCKHQFDQKA